MVCVDHRSIFLTHSRCPVHVCGSGCLNPAIENRADFENGAEPFDLTLLQRALWLPFIHEHLAIDDFGGRSYNIDAPQV